MGERKNVGKKYEFLTSDKLGSGAFAEVFKGKNKQTGEEVAIKVIKKSLLAKYGDEIINQIHQEVAILQQLVEASRQNACPFINRIYECLETSNNIYIVLEFCNEGTLNNRIKKEKTLPEKEATFILFQLLQALVLLANNNIAHRDIKPENVFIKDGVQKLGDFGFAGQKSLYQTHLGTFPYMAPEFFINDQYDSKVDVWALGLLTHEMLFGEIYYMGRSQFDVQQKILTKPYVLIDPKYNISQELKDLLLQMLNKDANQRISAIEALKNPLFEWCKQDNRYIQIMEKEKQFMAQFMGEGSQSSEQQIQIQEEERVKKELEEKQKQFEEQLKQQQNLVIQQDLMKIKEGIKDKQAGIILMVQLTDFLQANVIEICRYEILYILKQATILIFKLKENIDQKVVFAKFEHIKFDVDPETWTFFYEDIISLKQILEDLDQYKTLIRKRYIEYLNYINNFTSQNYSDSLQNVQSITNLDFTRLLDHQLYNEQLYQKIKFFKEDREKTTNIDIKSLINKCLLWLYAAYEYQKLCSGKLMDITKFLEAIEADDILAMKECIKWE